MCPYMYVLHALHIWLVGFKNESNVICVLVLNVLFDYTERQEFNSRERSKPVMGPAHSPVQSVPVIPPRREAQWSVRESNYQTSSSARLEWCTYASSPPYVFIVYYLMNEVQVWMHLNFLS
jgi:hypothetical protein